MSDAFATREILQVMVVDDEPDMREAVDRALSNFVHRDEEAGYSVGFNVMQAGSAERAWDLAVTVKPDIMLLDHGLPGMSGIELLEKIGKEALDILVIVITGYGTLANAVEATRLGAFDFLTKPFAPAELQSVVRKSVEHIAVQRQIRRIAEERRSIRYEFLTSLVDQLKEPISAVEESLRAIRESEKGADSAERQMATEQSLARLDGMRKLIYDLLDLTRIEAGKRKRHLVQVDVAAIARKAAEAISDLAVSTGIAVEVHAPSSLEMLADADEVEIIINKLLSNAITFNRPDGTVAISCDRRDEAVVITVRDTGIGMTAEETDLLFREFSRIRNAKTIDIPGSGLGLSAVKRLAELYDGSVEVQSEPEVGSTFTVTLPDRKTFVDNEFYDREAPGWWSDTENPLLMMRYMMNPVRFAYVIRRLVERSYEFRGRRALDIGCGGGFLTEEIARFGIEATGIDPSAPSLVTARSHARALNLHIDYQEGVGEALLFPDNHFDLVFCVDVLEHVSDYRKVIAEISRVLAPGGFFFFETVNRTILSYLVVDFFMQRFLLTRMVPRGIHNWRYFIRPGEFRRTLEANGMSVEDMTGVRPGVGFLSRLPRLRALGRDGLSVRELCSIVRCRESAMKSLCYVGYARKRS